MTTPSRSLDDLPLAAYSTGSQPDARLEAWEATAPEASVPPVDQTAMAALPRADGEPDPGAARTPGHLRLPTGLALPPVPEWLAHPRRNLRDPRLFFTGVIAVGVVLLAISLLPGGGPAGAGAAGASPSAGAFIPSAPPPAGNASVDVTGKVAATLALTGLTGSGAAVASQIDATWGDATGATLGLRGLASGGTRTTDAGFVLTLTVLVNGAPVTFTSDARECTVGMAVQTKWVNGTFVCKKLKSDDGKLVVDARGSYRT